MPKMHSGAVALAAALFVSALAMAPAQRALAAARFSVSPLSLTLPANKLATSLTLGNGGPRPVTVQAELVSWTQDGGEDRFGPATGMVVSPPIFELKPGSQQVVRVGRLQRGTPGALETAYRIRLTEVPPKASDAGEAVSTFMQVSLPIFVPPANRKASPAVQFKAELRPDGAVRIALANAGEVHDKVVRLSLLQDGKVVADRALNYYVLAGARRELAWPGALAAAPAGPLELRVQLDGRDRFVTLAVAPPPPPATAAPPKPGD